MVSFRQSNNYEADECVGLYVYICIIHTYTAEQDMPLILPRRSKQSDGIELERASVRPDI